jgi:hypothetical protein
MKNIILSAISILGLAVAACNSTNGGYRKPASSSVRPVHYVVTVHGVRGTAQSFGAFHEIVKPTLERINPNHEVVAVNWTYPVGAAVNDGKTIWTAHRVAKRMNDELFLGANAKIPRLNDGDKISILAYSMGGMTVMTWYYDTMFNFAGQKDMQYSTADHDRVLEYLEKTENIVGLGAVYWGSIDAELGWAYLEKGDTTQLLNVLPKVKRLCDRPEIQDIVAKTSVTEGFLPGSAAVASIDETNENFVKKSVKIACESLGIISRFAVNKKDGKRVPAGMWDAINAFKEALKGISVGTARALTTELGNVNPQEMDNMRLTSELLDNSRVGRIRHLTTPELASRYKTRWSSIVGVFPCLGKADHGVTCTKFKSDYFKRVNDGIVSAFSGLKRRESDGPVISPSADADFTFYAEESGKEAVAVTAREFRYSGDLERGLRRNQQIYVENMHASLVPVFEGLSGVFTSIGKAGASAMKNFDSSLGVDVAVIPKDCATAQTCHHPNYKHVLNVLAQCDGASASPCDQNHLNPFFGARGLAGYLQDNQFLKSELGSFVLHFNIQIPKGYANLEELKVNYLKYFKFKVDSASKPGDWTERRIDTVSVPYAMQIARDSEVMSSFVASFEKDESTVIRIYFVGRTWAKPGREAEARNLFAQGVPVPVSVTLPGLQPRQIEAVVRPAQSTYVGLFMK